MMSSAKPRSLWFVFYHADAFEPFPLITCCYLGSLLHQLGKPTWVCFIEVKNGTPGVCIWSWFWYVPSTCNLSELAVSCPEPSLLYNKDRDVDVLILVHGDCVSCYYHENTCTCTSVSGCLLFINLCAYFWCLNYLLQLRMILGILKPTLALPGILRSTLAPVSKFRFLIYGILGCIWSFFYYKRHKSLK